MTLTSKVLLWLLGIAVVLAIGLPNALSYYDSRTRSALLAAAASELRPRASEKEMVAFMQRHTARYSLDAEHHHEYAGIVAQTEFDKALFDRKVQMVLKLDNGGTYERAEVRVFYTAL